MSENEPLQSFMTDRPDYLAAIGLISVEIANLEQEAARLLAAISGIHHLIAEAVYFTPNAAIARLDILSNVAPLTLHSREHKPLLTKTNRLVERAKAAMGKRHQIMHSAWLPNHRDDDLVRRFKLPIFDSGTPLSVTDLINVAVQIQTLNADMSRFTGHVVASLPRREPPLREYWSR